MKIVPIGMTNMEDSIKYTSKFKRCKKYSEKCKYPGPKIITLPTAWNVQRRNFIKGLDKYLEIMPDQPGCNRYVGL